MKRIALALIAMAAMSANAFEPNGYTDFKCLNECTAKGYMYGYCQKACSY